MTTPNQRIMKAAITSGQLKNPGAGGYLGPDQADKFIDYMVDSSVLMKRGITVRRMNGDTAYLDDIGVGNRLIRKGVENTAPTNQAGVSTGRRIINTVEVILPYDLTYQFLEDNIEKKDAEDHVARLMSGQFSNDIEDLGINGDEADADAFVQIKDGWLKIFRNDPLIHKFDNNASVDYKGVVFPGMMAAMPEKWKRNTAGLYFLVAPSVDEAYRYSMTSRATGLGDDVLESGRPVSFMGIPLLPVPFLPVQSQVLTRLPNLAVGIKRSIMVESERKPRERRIEYTTTMRIGYQVVAPDQAVLSENFA